MIRYMKKGQDILFFSGDIQIARLIGCSDVKDTLTILEDGIFEWRRQCKPVKKMCMELDTCYSSEFYLITGINYNVNGFGLMHLYILLFLAHYGSKAHCFDLLFGLYVHHL